ncbi:MAG: cohesin domain-containing protein, partial [bacterium]
ITDDASWLEVTPPSGTSKTGEKTHTVSVDVAGLSEGTYTATITITDTNATNSPKQVGVTLTVSKEPPPQISLSTQKLSFSATAGGANPPASAFKVKNSGGGTLQYDVAWSATWLSISPTGGTSQGAEVKHKVSVNIAGLSVGTYTDTIVVSDPDASNSPQIIDVTLKVESLLTDNRISISCGPASAGTGTVVKLTISIRGNLQEIKTFGLELTFDSNVFQYQSTSAGNLTNDWASVAGNQTGPGTLIIGGFMGSRTPIAKGSQGSIAVVRMKVTCTSCSDGLKSQIQIKNYTDDIVGMKPEPASTTFTYTK